ncbi:MAG: hypothetical protein M0P66_18845, partial [Salinivirgaceae bacterium]|nr:hypothetical protein [Salinivirgaceae bacterium]
VDALSDDIKLSIEFFNKIYGKNVSEDFYVSEIPAYYGEAFPGFLHLSLSTFLSNNNRDGFNENFCSHEVSHQWWGIGVDFETYRDQWISEGFASYSGLLYTQLSLKNNRAFFEILKESKVELFNLRKGLFFDGVKAGPISLGYRNNTQATSGDYDKIVYNKGAWVLHMLRNLFIDFNTMDDKIFFTMLKEFFETHKDSYATTQDFIDIVTKYAGTDMTWFFEQWVESNEMPTYTFGYKTEKTPEGKFKVTGRIKQTGVNDKFMMPVPVKIDYGDSYVTLRLNVIKPFTEFEFPLFDIEPKEFQLNAYESVLCEVEYEDFEDIQP